MGSFLNVAAKSIYEISQGAKAQGTRQVICKITFVNFSLTSRKGYFLAQFIAIVDNALISGHPGGGGGLPWGMARDLFTFKPGMGGCIAFVISWHDPRGKARRMRTAAAILAENTTDPKKKKDWIDLLLFLKWSQKNFSSDHLARTQKAAGPREKIGGV